MQNAIQANHVMLIIFSLILGGIIGELLQIEYRLEQVGDWFESWFQELVTSEIITAITAAGGLLIFAIGFNLLEVTETKIKVGNLLPALFIIVILVVVV